jgi:hypothetical protein
MTKGTFNTQLLLNGDFEDFAIDFKISGDEITIERVFNLTLKREVRQAFFFTLVDRSDIINDIMDQYSERVYDDFLDPWDGANS